MTDETFTLLTEVERLDWAQNNWTAWGGLGDAARSWLKERAEHVGYAMYGGTALGYLGNTSLRRCSEPGDLVVFRLSPDYKLPKPARKYEVCEVYAINSPSKPPRYWYERKGCRTPYDYLVANQTHGFAGVQFEGQSIPDSWCMDLHRFINDGKLWPCSAPDVDDPVAVPTKVRFLCRTSW